MGKGRPLSNVERGKILAFSSMNLSRREIARRVNRSAKVVSNFLRDPEAYGTHYKPERDKALTDRDRRRLFVEARKTGSSAKTLQLDAGVRATQRELQNNDLFEYVKRNHTPKMTPSTKKRVNWAKAMLKNQTD